MPKYKGYLIDLDGTIYLGKKRLPEAEQFIKELQIRNIPFLFVTNNATKTPETVQQFLSESIGIDVPINTIYTSAMAAVDYLVAQPIGKKGFVIGENALKQPFEAAGFIHDEENPDFVLQGLDQSITYDKLKKASLAIQRGAKYVVTNADKQYPTEQGFIPGSGSITALLTAATRTEPLIIGKPESIIMAGALKRIGLTKLDVIMVGDNYDTDILAGIHFGVDTLLTLTGITQPDHLNGLEAHKQPTYIVENLSHWQFD